VTLHLVDVRLTCLINITYLLSISVISLCPVHIVPVFRNEMMMMMIDDDDESQRTRWVVARLAEEEITVWSNPAQHIDEEFLDLDVFEVHEQPV